MSNVSSLRIYVAGSSAEMLRAEGWMIALRKAGHTVTSSWPEVIRRVGEANPMHADRTLRAEWATTDLAEVMNSNVFWFLLPQGKPSAGAYTELGCAIMVALTAGRLRAMGIPVADLTLLVSGGETSIFTAVARHFATDELAFEAVQQLALDEGEDDFDDDDDDDDDGYDDDDYDDDDYDDDDDEPVYEVAGPRLPPTMTAQLNAIFAKPK